MNLLKSLCCIVQKTEISTETMQYEFTIKSNELEKL